MKFNGAPKQYVPLPQSQSDDELFRPDDRHVQGHHDAAAAATLAASSANGRPATVPGSSAFPYKRSASAATTQQERKQATGLLAAGGGGGGGLPASSSSEWAVEGKEAPLSACRKFCLVLSLLASALFVVGLGWLVPCRYGSLQALESVPIMLKHWEHLYQGLVLTSNVEASFGDGGQRECTVHLGFRRYADDGAPSVGMMAVNGMTGATLWSRELYASAVHQHCLLDVCFALGDGSNALLAALNKTSGEVLWYAHDHGGRLPGLQSIADFHVVPDCNGDGLPDLVISLQLEKPSGELLTVSAVTPAEWMLGLVSYEDGRLLAGPLPLPTCRTVPRIMGALQHSPNGSAPHSGVDILVHCLAEGNKGVLLKVALQELASANRTENSSVQVIWSRSKASPDGLRLAVLQGDEEPSVILAWGKGKLLKLAGSAYHRRWSTDLKLDSPIRSLVTGHFTAFSAYELFVVSDHSVQATLFQLLSVSTGHVSWQMQYDGTAAHVAHLVPAISRYVDGLVVRATSALDASRKDYDLWTKKLAEPKYARYLEKFHGIHNYDPKRHKLTLNTQEEQYFIVDFTNKTVDILARLTVQQLCLGGTCTPDIFSHKENVAMQVLQHRPGSYYLSLATSSANRRSNASVPLDTAVKVALLSHQPPSPTAPLAPVEALLQKHCCHP